MAKKQVDIFQHTITEQLLGPGSDVFGNDSEHEVISDFPLKRYYTGILFPPKILKNQSEKDTEITDDSGDPYGDTELQDESEDEPENEKTVTKKEFKDDNEEPINLTNHFHPTDMGISFCVDEEVESLAVNFSFATYKQPGQTKAKINISKNDYNTLVNKEYDFPFKDIVHYEKIDEQNGYMSLKEELKGEKKGKNRSGEYEQFDNWRNSLDGAVKETIRPLYEKFNKLIARLWQREPVLIRQTIPLEKNINSPIRLKDFSNAGYTLKAYAEHGRKYIKIQLVNMFGGIAQNKFSNAKETLNASCLFQAKISVDNDKLLSYKPYNYNKKYSDKEQQKLDFLYRQVEHFSIGHNCSSEWMPVNKPNEVSTTFLPTYNLQRTETKRKNLINVPLHDLSIWSKSKQEVVSVLTEFIGEYEKWIREQEKHTDAKTEIGVDIVTDLNSTFERLKESVLLLQKNDKLFKAFQYANTAMLLQFSLSDGFYKTIQNANLSTSPFNGGSKRSYYPFQLAFILLSLESTINPQSENRKNAVDLIWFPTGGGKTEAYLAVAALTIIWRRMNNQNYQGVSVIMRYTLRLLTAQQFERASRLVTALEYLRQKFVHDLQEEKISIGLWIGSSSTPNKLEDAKKATDEMNKKGESSNKFQLDKCPWCNDKLIKEDGRDYKHAFHKINKDLKIRCLNNQCNFFHSDGLPIQMVDEILYNQPPTLLFATVDKFAILSWQEKGHVFFNSLGSENSLPPDLIIQDELHLLTGPLGSIVGLFEAVIEDLCTKGVHTPKIIASTATTRNTTEQVKQLYGNRKVNLFPPPGLTYKDSFFARQSEDSTRRYLGFMPTGKTSVDSQVHLLATLLLARLKVYLQNETQIDPYWTLISYYNSLRDVGRMSHKIDDEIRTLTAQIQKRLRLKENFNHFGLRNRTRELTSRINSTEIKKNLSQLEQNFHLQKPNEKGFINVENNVVDLVLATNMLSVGIDIDRLNIMQINGMPRNIAEYIQASSRIGRQDKGLVIAFFDANRARNKSCFENFLSFHQSIYKQIEPLSITPFTQNTIDKIIASLLIIYIRHKIGLNKNTDAKKFKKDYIDNLGKLLLNRFPKNENMEFCLKKLEDLAEDWKKGNYKKYNKDNKDKDTELLKKPNTKSELQDKKWVIMQSMRDIDSNSFVRINLP